MQKYLLQVFLQENQFHERFEVMWHSRCESTETSITIHKVAESFLSGESICHMSNTSRKRLSKLKIEQEEKAKISKIIKEAVKANIRVNQIKKN